MNRLRALSNSKWDDPFFSMAMNKTLANSVERLVEENENNYQQSGLESCIKTRPTLFFEFFNNYEAAIPTNKVELEPQDAMDEEQLFSHYSGLHTILEEDQDPAQQTQLLPPLPTENNEYSDNFFEEDLNKT